MTHTGAMVSLGEIVRSAGASLRPLIPFDPAREISGVHVSELADPGRYLDGGELLLTTGIPLTGHAEDAGYVARIASHGAGALGIGLGEGWDDVPSGLAEHCRQAGIPLFVVPDGAPFLDVSRAFWTISGRDEQDAALRTAHAHTRLAQAAAGPEPLADVVRLMAEAIGGWAAWVPRDPSAPAPLLHPPSLGGLLPAVSADVERSLGRSGVTAASFVSQGSTVIAHAVTHDGRTLGALALGAGRPLSPGDRQLALTAVALLRLLLAAPDASGDAARWIAALLLDGQPDAARALGRAAGMPLPAVVRVLVDPDDAGRSASGLACERDGVRLRLVPASDDASADAAADVVLPQGAVGVPVTLESVPAAAARLVALWRSAGAAGSVTERPDRAQRWADALRTADPTLLETVRSYLRHHHHAERTARELGVHRNTVRPRIAVAERVLGVSLDDPDVSAELWLALRQEELTRPLSSEDTDSWRPPVLPAR